MELNMKGAYDLDQNGSFDAYVDDFDGDGDLDLVLAGQSNAGMGYTNTIYNNTEGQNTSWEVDLSDEGDFSVLLSKNEITPQITYATKGYLLEENPYGDIDGAQITGVKIRTYFSELFGNWS